MSQKNRTVFSLRKRKTGTAHQKTRIESIKKPACRKHINEKAVSPVVAVLLLLAITVLMAGYVALTVLSFDIAEPAPSAVLRAESVSIGGCTCIRLDHRGGDALDMNETRILFDGNTAVYDAAVTGKAFVIGDSLLICRTRTGIRVVSEMSALPAGASDLTSPQSISELLVIDDRTNQIIFQAKIR